MSILQLAGFSILAAVAALTLRRMRPELGAAVGVAGGVMVLLAALPFFSEAVAGIRALAEAGGVSSAYMGQLMKIVGVSLLMDFAAQTCRDAGEDGLAVKTELAGRALLLTLALPAMRTLLTQIVSLAP